MTVRICRAATLLSATLACLAACTTTPPPSTPAAAEVLAPNANLLSQGIPPVPLPLVRQVETLHRLPRPRLRRLASAARARCWSRTARPAPAPRSCSASRGADGRAASR